MYSYLIPRIIVLLNIFIATLCYSTVFADNIIAKQQKVLICGICRNIAHAVPNTIENIEKLGSQFADYTVILYENNSDDQTAPLLAAWAEQNTHVRFISENVPSEELPIYRTEKIARARNIVLDAATQYDSQKYKYLVMVDLDFVSPWPINEIIRSIELPTEWDCISANGIRDGDRYWDRYAYRNQVYPFGPEMIGKTWVTLTYAKPFSLIGRQNLTPVFSAFGGIAIYKTAVITQFRYSGSVNDDLAAYYKKILPTIRHGNKQLKAYLKLLNLSPDTDVTTIPIKFTVNECCEHVTLHAAMALKGYNKFFINPRMVLSYQ